MVYDLNSAGLFLTLGVSLVVGAAQIAGWKNKTFLLILAAIGTLCVVGAVSQPVLGSLWPALLHFMASAANPSSWLMLIILIAILILLGVSSRKERLEDLETQFASLTYSSDECRGRLEASITSNNACLNAIWEDLNKKRLAMENIERQIKVDAPNASTVHEAFSNLDTAVKSKIDRLSGEVSRCGERLGRADQDTLYLLDWAAFRTTTRVLERLLGEQPRAKKLQPPTDARARSELTASIERWLASVWSRTQDANYNAEIYRVSSNAKAEGDAMARRLPPQERPAEVDPVAFTDYYALAHQCEATGIYMRSVIEEIDALEESFLSRLRGQLKARTK